LREYEDMRRMRGNEPSLSYIAVVSGDKQVSVESTGPGKGLLLISIGDISIRLGFSNGCAWFRTYRIARTELLQDIPPGRTGEIGGGPLVRLSSTLRACQLIS
jgi:hypothetical protein